MAERSSIFDMIGPIMIGPSSSHTAGVVRIARTAVGILGSIPEEAEITFYNSFARTYEGHGSDRAIIAGLLDFATDDTRIKNSFDFAKEQNLQYTFKAVGSSSVMHPNTIKLNIRKGEKSLELIGISTGGGLIHIEEVNGFTANFSASLHTLIILTQDIKGAIAFIASILAQDDANIATMSVSRRGKNDFACQFIELDSNIRPFSLAYIQQLPWVKEVTHVNPVR
ncbi:MAG: L-serine ammonia-lyase, iron-sulfur-dependent subunit beta [Thermoflexibacter sp.]|jgi:L-serine dehydratase|nr:L-serine ammonia-lyase, iron-sulfur-dependent subunit beta [Thermoflexibacter sp.]